MRFDDPTFKICFEMNGPFNCLKENIFTQISNIVLWYFKEIKRKIKLILKKG